MQHLCDGNKLPMRRGGFFVSMGIWGALHWGGRRNVDLGKKGCSKRGLSV